eukprot:COSAG03_NODE_2080_length_3150_cov_2.491970_4_plen_49_part_00
MKVFPVPMLSSSACDGAAMERVIAQYFKATDSGGEVLPAQSYVLPNLR